MRSCISQRSNFSTRGGIPGISQRTVRYQRGYKEGFTASSFLTPLEPPVTSSSSGETSVHSTQAPAEAKLCLFAVDMDPTRNTVEAPAQDSALVGAVSAPPSTAVPSAPTSGLRGAAQLQAGAIDTQASATPADAELLSATSVALSPTAGENTAGEMLVPSAASTDAPTSSSRAATPVLDTVVAHIDADAPHVNVLASSHLGRRKTPEMLSATT